MPPPRRRLPPLALPFTPDRPLLHVHLQKCGGTSIDTLLWQSFPPGQMCRLELNPDCLAGSPTALHYPCYSGHVSASFRDRLPAGAVAFTFLRDPVDRALSAYRYFRGYGPAKLKAVGAHPRLERCCEMTLGEFLAAEPDVGRAYFGNLQTWLLSRDEPPFSPPWRPLTEHDLSAAKRALNEMAFVGLTERFAESIAVLCRRCDWPEPDAPPHENRTERGEGADAATRAALAELTSLDAGLYRYGEELFDSTDWTAGTPPAVPQVAVAFDAPIHGGGWLPPEVSADGSPFRWIGRSAWVGVPVTDAPELEVEVGLVCGVAMPQLEAFEVWVSGRRVPLARPQPDDPLHLVGRVAPGPSSFGRHRMELRCPNAVRPADLFTGNTDSRQLGVAVNRLVVRAVPAVAGQ